MDRTPFVAPETRGGFNFIIAFSEKAKYLPPLAIASIGAHWDSITGSPNELIISLTNLSVKLNTPIIQ